LTTQAQRFAKLLESFSIVYDSDGNDSIEYILKSDKNSDMPLVFDSEGDRIVCPICDKQLHYDTGDISCENDKCGDTRYEKLFGKNKK